LAQLPKESNAEISALLRAALGWGGDQARAEVIRGLGSSDLAVRRASFVAAERAAHPETVDALLKLLQEPDPETRFNAAYTLGRLTDGAISLNGLVPPERLKERAAAARAWWTANRDKAKLRRAEPYRSAW
jgi:HEAT repeat protein